MVRLLGFILVLVSIGCVLANLFLWLSIYQRAGLAALAGFMGGVGLGLMLMADRSRLMTLVIVFLVLATGLYGVSYGRLQSDLNKYHAYKFRAQQAYERDDEQQAEINEFAAKLMRQSLGRLKVFKDV